MADVDRLIRMMNQRRNTDARYAEGDEVAYYTYMSAEGGGWLDETGAYHIRLLQGVARRATAFHEWLHRCRRLRGIELDSQAAEEALIEGFLRRHSGVLGLSEGE